VSKELMPLVSIENYHWYMSYIEKLVLSANTILLFQWHNMLHFLQLFFSGAQLYTKTEPRANP